MMHTQGTLASACFKGVPERTRGCIISSSENSAIVKVRSDRNLQSVPGWATWVSVPRQRLQMNPAELVPSRGIRLPDCGNASDICSCGKGARGIIVGTLLEHLVFARGVERPAVRIASIIEVSSCTAFEAGTYGMLLIRAGKNDPADCLRMQSGRIDAQMGPLGKFVGTLPDLNTADADTVALTHALLNTKEIDGSPGASRDRACSTLSVAMHWDERAFRPCSQGRAKA
ncbi:hypothetical protein FB567DRAFT_539028 [Paraphoma chrysanthemicola]|uniref:Uncharacterized protein n=1 Tax=Paraphoma chrysanthemicola TaxID=798071 RepID=A0A8K0QUC8_9PLEO|nr:hypothetical protein FB567DRAFT_539028 [Paraphoma chrysanthemicola]